MLLAYRRDDKRSMMLTNTARKPTQLSDTRLPQRACTWAFSFTENGIDAEPLIFTDS
jgi:hypothetical protein